jgi:alkyldihydroxyacetonephosphate synthase
MNRIDQINSQFTTAKQVVSPESITVDGKTYPEFVDNNPAKGIKADYFKNNGWGYKDSGFFYDSKMDTIRVKGGRYMYEGKGLPAFLEYIKKHLNIKPQYQLEAQNEIPCTPPTNLNHAFIEELGVDQLSRRSFTNVERIMHSHGHTF